jgi:hypothetical protein
MMPSSVNVIFVGAVSSLRCDGHCKLNIVTFITLVEKKRLQAHFSAINATMISLQKMVNASVRVIKTPAFLSFCFALLCGILTILRLKLANLGLSWKILAVNGFGPIPKISGDEEGVPNFDAPVPQIVDHGRDADLRCVLSKLTAAKEAAI